MSDGNEDLTPPADPVRLLEKLRLLEQGTTAAEGLEFFDSLPPLLLHEATGTWQGAEVPTGHPLDGLLDTLGWHGKRFDGVDAAHPLVFQTRTGTLFEVNPGLVPLQLALRMGPLLRRPAAGGIARSLRPILQLARTTKPRARLRLMEYRGVISATMIYDRLPINDAFRRVDRTTLMGAMDFRGPGGPFIFSLRRLP